MMARTVVVLPTPLRPSTAVIGSVRHLEIDALQHMAGAVMGIEGFERKHQANPPR